MKFNVTVTFHSLVICVLMIPFVTSDCEVVINEINVIDPRKPEKKEFIELKSTCDTDTPLRGYKLIGFSCQSTTGTIDLVVNLWNFRMNKNGFFTVGGSVVDAELNIPSDYIRFKNSFGEIPSMTNFLAQKNVHAIGLLHDGQKLNSFSDFTLSKQKREIKISNAIIEQLKLYLVDLVVYGEQRACGKCAVFEKIKDEFAMKKIYAP